MKLWVVTCLFMSLAMQNQAYNILMLAPVGSWSEYRLAKTVGETLTEVGEASNQHHLPSFSFIQAPQGIKGRKFLQNTQPSSQPP